jgi:hypothetical protein
MGILVGVRAHNRRSVEVTKSEDAGTLWCLRETPPAYHPFFAAKNSG